MSDLKIAKDAVFTYEERGGGGDGDGGMSENEAEAACKYAVYHTISYIAKEAKEAVK